jgi:hypothetical protein
MATPQPLLASRKAIWIRAGEVNTGKFGGVAKGVFPTVATGVDVSGMTTGVGELALLRGVPVAGAGICT